MALGTTGETPALSKNDRMEATQAILRANAGRKPVVLGMGGNDTAELLDYLQAFDMQGIAGLLSVTPITTNQARKACISTTKPC